MKFIAYNTTLDIKSLIESKASIKDHKDKEAKRIFNENKTALLPYVLKYLHYLVELHNNLVLNSTFAGGNYRRFMRATSIQDNGEKVDLQEILKQYTTDTFFSDNGASWNCILFHCVFVNSPSIWLNIPSKFAATPHLPYSMTGTPNHQYAESIEDYIEKITEIMINSERSKN